ncbi:hypothetical protein HG536_0A05610 [Torulaspora globosa]|uniref:UBX domain-containing protein n=1 Tax=Torulaspora globosa TaxID=48254 RepID=A0A7G3ZB60_9SACH|nr:uncharacterized protein HG536_0A05610 [Torulaspora globosa]QLL30746.1 hypothetical protein HG536_0A05610 [Torulaspora globosa]
MPIVRHNDEEYHLSHEEEEKLNEFRSITDFPEDDLPLIIRLLQNYGWHLERALGLYFDGDWKRSVTTTDLPAIPVRPPTPAAIRAGTAPIGQREPFVASDAHMIPSLHTVQPLPENFRDHFSVVGLGGKRGDVWNITSQESPFLIILMFIPRVLMKLGARILFLLWSLITFGFQSHIDERTKVCKIPDAPKKRSGSLKEVLPQHMDEKSLARLNRLISDLSFNEALKVCQEEFKYLLLIVIGDVIDVGAPDFNSRRFLSKVLSNPAVISLLEKYKDELVIYLRSADELETWLVAQQLHVKYTPECLLIANVLNSNGSLNGITRLSVLSKVRISSPKKFENSLKVSLERFHPELVVSRTEQAELRLAREIKEMQDAAYEASLEQDRFKEQERILKEQQERELKQSEQEREKEREMKETLKHLTWLQCCIEVANQELSPSDTKKKATLQIRTSNGQRFVKKFASTTSLRALYVNIGCHLYLQTYTNDSKEWVSSMVKKIESLTQSSSVHCFKGSSISFSNTNIGDLAEIIEDELNKLTIERSTNLEFDFELVSPFPREKISVDENLALKDVSQLWPNGSLLVEDIIEESDVDEDDDEAESIDE